MANEKKKTEVATTGNQTPASIQQEKEQYTPIQQGGIDYGNVMSGDVSNMDSILDAFDKATVAPIDANRETWNPKTIGEKKILMFLNYDMISVEFQGKEQTVPYVVFAEPRVDSNGERFVAQVMTARSQIVNFFLSVDRETKFVRGGKQKQHSLWEIAYNGTKQTNKGNVMHSYSIKPATVA